jgi:ATP-binding cassette subfamily B multidrug efflux pump
MLSFYYNILVIDMKTFKTLKNDLLENRGRILLGLLSLLIVDVLQLLIPRIIKHAIDDLTLGGITRADLVIYGAEILILALAIGAFRYVWRHLLMGTARRVEKALRDRLFLHLQTLSLSYFSRTKIGDLMAHATNDIEAVRMSLAMGLVFMVDTFILGTLTLFFMIYIHPMLTLYSVLPMPLITVITLLFSRVIHDRFEDVQKSFSSLTERVREAISGIRVVKAYVQEEKEREKLSQLSEDYVVKNMSVTKVWGMFFPVLLLLSNLCMVIVLYFGGQLTILQSITAGDFVAFISYLGILSWPMMAFGWAINIVQRGAASMDRLNRILEEKPEIVDGSASREIGWVKGRIEVKGLTWRAGNGGVPLLQDIHLEVKQGELVILVGRTGAGKTLFCNLLGRVLEPPERTVFVDGVDIHHIPLRTLRGSIGFVPQDTFLFSETIRENIAFGKLEATGAEIEQAARIAQIYDEIMGFPEGMETMVGEKGITLSGGQRQRIAIARAVLMDPPIFVLDDALSSVDIQTEERILKGLETFLKGRTCLLVTHRIAPLRRADRIVVLHEGRIVEVGDHGTLLARGGIYTDLYWREQLQEELEKESNH